MNKYLTYTARAKLRSLFEASREVAIARNRPIALKITQSRTTGFDIAYIYSGQGELLICSNPPVISDVRTLKMLEEHSIDFDYTNQEFIFKRAA